MKHLHRLQRRQAGVTLIITMVMLVLITLVGVAVIRSTTMDEKMAGNTRDRDKALQSAEAAVRVCLAQVIAGTVTATVLAPAPSTATANWAVPSNWSVSSSSSQAVSTSAIDAATAGLAAQPRCMFELLGAGSGNYRVTGRALGASAQTEVILQATYSPY